MKTAPLTPISRPTSIALALLLGSSAMVGSHAIAQSPATSQPPPHFVGKHAARHGTAVAPIQRMKAPRGDSTEFAQRAKPNTIDWTTLPSSYSHDENGTRLDQYSPGVQPVVALSPDYTRSGFRHTRSTLQAGFSSDNYHVVEQWGGDVRPYGEWRYPYRPFAVPYGMWGPQLPQVVGGFPWAGFAPQPGFPAPNHPNGPSGAGAFLPPSAGPNPMPPGNFPTPVQPGVPHWFGSGGGFGVGPWNALGPMQDDYYPQAPSLRAPKTPDYAPLGIGLP